MENVAMEDVTIATIFGSLLISIMVISFIKPEHKGNVLGPERTFVTEGQYVQYGRNAYRCTFFVGGTYGFVCDGSVQRIVFTDDKVYVCGGKKNK